MSVSIHAILRKDVDHPFLIILKKYYGAPETHCLYISFQKDFCGHVEERYNLVHHQHNSDVGNAFMREIAEVVQQFKTTTFFQQASPPQSFTYV